MSTIAALAIPVLVTLWILTGIVWWLLRKTQ